MVCDPRITGGDYVFYFSPTAFALTGDVRDIADDITFCDEPNHAVGMAVNVSAESRDIVGTWEWVSVDNTTPDGVTMQPFGLKPGGYLSFASSGSSRGPAAPSLQAAGAI
jgi:hypothetical protein